MKQINASNFSIKTKMLLHFVSTLSAVFVAVVAALLFAGPARQPMVNAAQQQATANSGAVNAAQGGTACALPSGGAGAAASSAVVTSAFRPVAGGASHSVNNTAINVDSHDENTNILSNNETNLLNNITAGDINVPILDDLDLLDGTSILDNSPVDAVVDTDLVGGLL